MTGRLTRRQLLAGTGVAGAALVAVGSDVAGAAAAPASFPFHGAHQAGVTTPAQTSMVFATFDVTADTPGQLAKMLAGWSRAASRLTQGRELVGQEGPYAPPADTGEARGLPSSGLTITVGFGPTLFDRRFGLAHRRPDALVELPPFAGDALDPTFTGGDLCLQACANHAQVAFHAVHELTRLALGSATVRSLQSGFAPAAAPGGGRPTPRNLLGFHDGTHNLDPTDTAAMQRFVWVDNGDRPWMDGGTYLVMRRIRIHLEAWDRSTLGDQEQTIGRQKVSGAPLGGTGQFAPVDLSASGGTGQPLIPDNAHIRLAAPATNDGQAILRRGYSFMDGVDPESGEIDAGLLFVCFQKDPRAQFIPIQTRLSLNDALSPYLVHTGSGVFACPAGTAPDPAGETGCSDPVGPVGHSEPAHHLGMDRRGRYRSVEDDGPVGVDQHPVLEVPAQSPGQDRPLHVPTDAQQIVDGVAMVDAADVLLDDGAGVQLGGHVVAGGPDQLDAPLEGLMVGTGPGERGEEAVMDVDDPSGVAVAHLGRDDLHVPGQHDDVGFDRVDNAMSPGQTPRPCALCPPECGRSRSRATRPRTADRGGWRRPPGCRTTATRCASGAAGRPGSGPPD